MEPATQQSRLIPEQGHAEALQIGEYVRLIFMISDCGIALLAKTLRCYWGLEVHCVPLLGGLACAMYYCYRVFGCLRIDRNRCSEGNTLQKRPVFRAEHVIALGRNRCLRPRAIVRGIN